MDTAQLVYARNIFLFVSAYLIFSFLSQTLNGIILAYEYYSFASLQKTIRTLVRAVLLFCLIFSHPCAILVAITDFLLSILMLLTSYFYCKRKTHVSLRPGKIDRAILRSSAPLCAAIFMQAIVNQANNNVDKFLIGVLMSPEWVSMYSVALYVFNIFSSLTTIPISQYAPTVSKTVGSGTPMQEVTVQLIAPCRLTALIGGLILFGFISVGKPFISLLYGNAYLPAWLIAVILIAPMYLNMVTGVLENVLDALNKRIIRSYVLLLTTAVNIVLTIFWLNRWGITGAAAATGICTLIGQVLLMNLYQFTLKIPVYSLFRQAFRGILPWLVLGCLGSLAAGTFVSAPLTAFLLGGTVFLLIALGGYVLWGMSGSERKLVSKLLRRRNDNG